MPDGIVPVVKSQSFARTPPSPPRCPCGIYNDKCIISCNVYSAFRAIFPVGLFGLKSTNLENRAPPFWHKIKCMRKN